MLELNRIGLFTRDEEQDYRLNSMEKLFRRAHIELVHDAASAEPGSLDLVIALGGDGTVLRALAAHPGTPILAVNFGSVGFLTQSDRDHLDKVLVRVLSDDYSVAERLTLEVRHRGQVYRAINEAVIKGINHMVTCEIRVNGMLVHSPRGDGVIVGTPTGTTAYLLSTGAPLITPEVQCIVVKPLNEYSFSSRSVIMPPDTAITITLCPDREKNVGLSVDGGDRVPVEEGDVIEVTKSEIPARLVYFEPDSFFRNLKERLRW